LCFNLKEKPMARSADFNWFLNRIAEAAGLREGSFSCVLANADRILALVTAGRAAEASQTPVTGAPETPKAAIIPEPPAPSSKSRNMAALHEASAKSFERAHQAPRGEATGTGWARILDATKCDLGKKS
jgi:hypothetical protein